MTFIPGTHTFSEILLHIFRQTLWPIFSRKSPQREENSSLFAHLDSINKEDEELSLLGGENKTNKLQLGRYIEVLQIKRKEMDTGKKSLDLLTLAANKLVWPMDAPLAEKNLLGAKSSGSLS